MHQCPSAQTSQQEQQQSHRHIFKPNAQTPQPVTMYVRYFGKIRTNGAIAARSTLLNVLNCIQFANYVVGYATSLAMALVVTVSPMV
jgi:hypothetical protein